MGLQRILKEDLNDSDNQDGVIAPLEPDILESEVKWAFGSITMNKAGGGAGIPAELFEILEDDAVKGPHSLYFCWCDFNWVSELFP